MAKLETARPNLDPAVQPKRKPDRFKPRNEKVQPSKISKSRKTVTLRSRAKAANAPTKLGRKSLSKVRSDMKKARDYQRKIAAEQNGIESEIEEEEPHEPGAKRCFFIRKAWGKDPAQLHPRDLYPCIKNKGKVFRIAASEKWPREILDFLRDFAETSLKVGKGEVVASQCIAKIVEATRDRLKQEGEAVKDTVKEGLTFEDACAGGGLWTAEHGVRIE